MYKEFKEDCPICSSPAVRVMRDDEYEYDFIYLKCDDCGSEYGSNDILRYNISNKHKTIL